MTIVLRATSVVIGIIVVLSVVSGAPGHVVGSNAAVEMIGTSVAVEPIVVVSTGQVVITGVPVHEVSTAAAMKTVAMTTALDPVATGTAVDPVASPTTADDVPTARSVNGVRATVGDDDVRTRGTSNDLRSWSPHDGCRLTEARRVGCRGGEGLTCDRQSSRTEQHPENVNAHGPSYGNRATILRGRAANKNCPFDTRAPQRTRQGHIVDPRGVLNHSRATKDQKPPFRLQGPWSGRGTGSSCRRS